MSAAVKKEAIIEEPKSIYKRAYPVRLAYLHQTITWPGCAGSEKSLSETRIPGLKMYLEPQLGSLLLEIKGKQCCVPLANVANFILFDGQ